MADYPQSPSSGMGSTRPGVVTAAAVLLFVAGGFAILTGLLALALSSLAAILAVFAVLYLAVGALEIYAGVLVLQLRERGRMIGMVLAAIGALFALILIGKTPFTSIISLAINGFVIWALYSNESHFRA